MASCAGSGRWWRWSSPPGAAADPSTARPRRRPSPSSTAVPPSAPLGSSPAAAPEGFRAVLIEVTKPDGTKATYCVWLAATEPERERGLMQVTGLGGADGMLFRFGADAVGRVLDEGHGHPAVHRLLQEGRRVRLGDGHGAMLAVRAGLPDVLGRRSLRGRARGPEGRSGSVGDRSVVAPRRHVDELRPERLIRRGARASARPADRRRQKGRKPRRSRTLTISPTCPCAWPISSQRTNQAAGLPSHIAWSQGASS